MTDATQIPRYPSSASRIVLFLRFLNVLDDTDNKWSPVKINAWVSTLGALYGVFGQTNAVVTGSSLFWTGMAHLFHQADKLNRAKIDASQVK